MNYIERMKQEWAKNFSNLQKNSKAFGLLSAGKMTIPQYREIVRQIYHNTRVTPQLMAFSTMFLKEESRGIAKTFFRHSLAETGHDQLAKQDYVALGGDGTQLANENFPSGAVAMNGAMVFLVQFVSPLCLLGYMFHLEYTPAQMGLAYIDKLQSIGVPNEALNFIIEHAEVDPSHVKLMDDYVAQMVRSEDDFKHVLYGMQVTNDLYGRLMDEAIDRASN